MPSGRAAPNDLNHEYYSQRASDGGLIFTEATAISATGRGYRGAPGIYSDEQVVGWKRITDAVHAKGGRMFVQLWHAGHTTHIATTGEEPVTASVHSGQKPPKHNDTEQTIDEVRARIRKTVGFVESVAEAQYADAAEQRVSLSFAPAGRVLVGPNYLLQMKIPNVYFHLAMAYAMLRHHGVDVGKMDFLGPIN